MIARTSRRSAATFTTSILTLHLFGRGGMHKYNNPDQATMTAMLAVRSVLAGAQLDEVWKTNEGVQFHEAGYAPMRQALDSVWCIGPIEATAPQSSPRAPQGSVFRFAGRPQRDEQR